MRIGGSAGDDELYGGRGDDLIWGGRGDDLLVGGDGDDTLFCGLGATPRTTAARPAVASTSRWKPGPDWPDSDGWPDEAVGDNFSSIENLVGTKFNDWLAADAGDNRRGNDWIFGGSDEDTLLGGEGHDNLFGGRSDEMLFGGVGADNLFGDAGDDMLFVGGDGPDRIDGGPGSDTVTFVGAAGWRDGEPR